MRLADIERMATDTLGLDTETWCTGPGNLAPPLVCASLAWLNDGKIEGKLYDEAGALAVFGEILAEKHPPVLGLANGVFDLLVFAVRMARAGIDIMPDIYRLLMDDRCLFDLQIAEALDAVAEGCLGKDPRTGGELINPETGRRGRYSLAMVVDLVLGRKDAKENDEWRKAYRELHPFPIEQWPETARIYPVEDACNHTEVPLAQAGHWPRVGPHRWAAESMMCEWCGLTPSEAISPGGEGLPCRVTRRSRNLHDLANQVAAAFALHAGAAWGFLIDQGAVDLIENDALEGKAENLEPFIAAKLIRPAKTPGGKTSKDMAAIARRVALAYGASPGHPCETCAGTGKVPSEKNPKSKINCKACAATSFDLSFAPDVPRTDGDAVSAKRDSLNESGDELLMSLADYFEDAKTLQTYVPYLRRGRTPVAGHDDTCPMKIDEKKACTCPGPYRSIPLTLWPNVLLETGRVSYGGVVQQLPRKPRHRANEHSPWIPSLRECFVARPGYVYSSEDYEAGELITHAESCIILTGFSAMADALNAGVKVHNALGASMIGLSYEDFQARVKETVCKDARQAAKPGNFGFPGGMGPVKMVLQQRKQGPDTPHPNGPTWVHVEGSDKKVRGYKGLRFCILMDGAERCGGEGNMRRSYRDKPIAPTCAHCIECAIRLKATWIDQWPENTPYFEHINSVIDNGQTITAAMLDMWPHLQEWFYAGQQLAPGEVMQHYSGRIRQVNTATTDSPYCSAANGYFQGLLADAAKAAAARVSRECYDRTVRVPTLAHANSLPSRYAGGPSPLLGSRLILFAHDEQILEHPETEAHDGATRVSEVMVDELRVRCPHLAPSCKADPTLMRRWQKGATSTWARGGNKPADADDRLIPWQHPED